MNDVCKYNGSCGTLKPFRFGLALGIFIGVALLVMAVIAYVATKYNMSIVYPGAASVYLGGAKTFTFALMGAVWGFVDGFVGGTIFVWFYNIMAFKCCKCKKEEK